MVNYNQKYKDQVITAITDNNNKNFDASLTDNGLLSAVGQKIGNSSTTLTNISNFVLFSVKPDTMFNFTNAKNINFHDDNRMLLTFDPSSVINNHWSSLYLNPANSLSIDSNNITFDDFNNGNMTTDISTLSDTENFTATINMPNDVKCNYTTGNHKHVKTQTVNILLDGNIRKGDTVTIKRDNREDKNATINFDTDLAFVNLGMDGTTKLEIIYNHAPKPSVPVFFTSDDAGAKWTNNKLIDDGKGTLANPIVFQKGYKLNKKLRIDCTDIKGSTDMKFFGTFANNFDGDDPQRNTWNFTVPEGYVKFNIHEGYTEYKKYNIVATLQNATMIEPKLYEDVYGKKHYDLDPNHTTITVKASDGYVFDNDGTLTYQKDATTPATMTVKANHADTITIDLPSDINWLYQKYFTLTLGASKSEIVENSGGFTNIYKADYTNLLKFSNEVIVKITGGAHANVQAYNVTQYINNLVMLPFNVPKGATTSIVAGDETFTTQLPTVDNNYLTVDLGKITVNEQYKNGYDYYQVKTRLMLPYTNMIDLDPEHVINKTVSIKYVVNVVNGDTTINLYNDEDLFYSEQVNLANEVPFISSARNGAQYAVINQLKTMFRNDIQQPYIIIEQPTPILNSDYYPTNEKGTLKGYTGNVKVNLLNNMDINTNDLTTLQKILETGVKIK